VIKYYALFLAAVLAFLCFPVWSAALTVNEIDSEAAVLLDADTGQVLFEKNSHRIMNPASTTKIMTGLLITELCDMDDLAVVTKTALAIDEWNSANIALIEGEELAVGDLLYGIMLPSANDASNVLAEHAAGSQSGFAELMTQRAMLIGAIDTRFQNAHGLTEEGHYTTAYDMALITREAVKSPLFMKYFGAPSHVIPPTNLQPHERFLGNFQYMLVPESNFYDPYVTGGKIGYTYAARHTMSTIKVKHGRALIAVVFGAPDRDAKFYDTEKLFDFGMYEFIDFEMPKNEVGFEAEIISANGGSGPIVFHADTDFKALLHKSIDPGSVRIKYSHEGPFRPGENIESYAYFSISPGNPAVPDLLGVVKLTADYSGFIRSNDVFERINTMISRETISSWWFFPLMVLLFAALAATILFITVQISKYLRMKHRNERLQRLKRNREAYRESLSALYRDTQNPR